jgi:hypothetical protein
LIRCSDQSPGIIAKVKLDQPDLTQEEIKRFILLDTNFHYPLAKAKQDAITIAAELDREELKNGIETKRTIEEILSYSIPDTIYHSKSKSKVDPGVHVFNFGDNRGFAIISGDKRIEGRLGWSGNGKIDRNPHAGLRIFLSKVVPYFQYKRQEVEAMRGDSLHRSLLLKLSKFKKKDPAKGNPGGRIDAEPCLQLRTDFPCPAACTLSAGYTQISSVDYTTTVVAPLLKTNWDQYAPYNNLYESGCNWVNNCVNAINNNYKAGCVPISEAQVIAYFYDKRYGGDWTAIANNPGRCYNATQAWMVAALVKGVYDHYWVTSKTCDGGTFTFDRDVWFLNGDRGIHPDFGLVQGDWREYNTGDLRASILNGSPVPTQGSQHEWCLLWNWGCVPDPTVMHQWVMDGILTTNRSTTYMVNPVDYDLCQYLPSYTFTSYNTLGYFTHINWGWGNNGSSGWYSEAVFGGWNVTGSHWENKYDHDVKIIAYINQY